MLYLSVVREKLTKLFRGYTFMARPVDAMWLMLITQRH